MLTLTSYFGRYAQARCFEQEIFKFYRESVIVPFKMCITTLTGVLSELRVHLLVVEKHMR
jgi:hypothetical protein